MIRGAAAGWVAVAAAVLGVSVVAAVALAPPPAVASFANEFPRAEPVVSFHPRADAPFTLDQLRRALRAGVHGVELDLRWRAADSTVVCAHDAKGLEERPSFVDALNVIFRFQGPSRTVQGDERQFYLTLDLKQEGEAYHRAILDTLRDRAPHWSTSALPGEEPRGITVVVSGSRAAFERAAPATHVDSLCLIEGEDATLRRRILDLSDRDGPLAWVALQHPTTRERIHAIHEGRDAQYGGRFNVRVYGAGRQFALAMDMGADAVNADLEEIVPMLARAKARAQEAAGAPRTAKMQTGSGFWTFQGWRVDPGSFAEFEAAWRKRASSRRTRATGLRSELLLRDEDDTTVYQAVERWEGSESWLGFITSPAAWADTSLRALLSAGVAHTTQEMVEVEDRFGAGPVAGDHVRFYHITTREGTTRAFIRAFRRANDAIRAAYPDALGAALARESNRATAFLEIVRWKSEDAWRRFAAASPPDPDADAAVRAAIGDIVTRRYVAIAISP